MATTPPPADTTAERKRPDADAALAPWGWDDRWRAVFSGTGTERGRPARVSSSHRHRWTVQAGDGPHPARIVGPRPGRPPVTGDWVVASPGATRADPWSIDAILPPRTAVSRGAAGAGQSAQILAANVDRLWIVHGLDTDVNRRRLERYLAIGWESGAQPEIVLTKADLADDLEGVRHAVTDIAIGVPVRVVSVSDPDAIDRMRASLAAGSTVALVGPSGAGKSTLINRLAGATVVRTGTVRAGDRKGRHTTSARELIRIHGDALLLDTPGLRELRVLGLDTGLARTFPEIDELAEGCRFRDCIHRTEPGCAVLRALDEGRLAADRLASYRKLQAEAEYARRKTDPRAMAAYVGETKTAMNTLKHHLRDRERE